MMGGGMMGYGGGFFGFLWMVLIIAIVVGIIYVIIRMLQGNSKFNLNHSSNEALDVLKQRYVKGEITEEEYLNMKQNI